MTRKIGARTPNRRRLWIAVAGVACAALIAACGSSSHEPSASSNNPELARSECMRAHGVPHFPDPTKGSGGEGLSVSRSSPDSSAVTVDGITFDGPAFQAAAKTCRLGGPALGGEPHKLTETQRNGMTASARCTRKHGVPNFPDPTFGSRGIGVKVTPVAGVDPDSPAFQAANKLCTRSERRSREAVAPAFSARSRPRPRSRC
jgi:hypothetical protein